MRIIDLALKDLSQIFRDKRAALFLVAMPIIFTLFMGFAYSGGGSGQPGEPQLVLGWVNNDPDGLLAQQLFDSLTSSESLKVVTVAPDAVDDSVRRGEVNGVLVVPVGFSQGLQGQPHQLVLVADSASTTGQSLFQLVQAPVTQLMSSVEIARLSAATFGQPDNAQELEQAFGSAALAWRDVHSAALVKVEKAVVQPQAAWYGDNPYNQASPGILVQFAIFGLVTSGQILVQERKTRTLQRMMTTTLHVWEIVAGHLLAMLAVVLLQEALLIVFGQFALGVNYAREPLGVLMVALTLGLWIAALGLLISVLVKDDSQVVLVSLMAMFIFSALGGTWFPLEVSSGAFALIGQWMPSAWAMTGFQNILIRGLSSASVWVPSGILLTYALVFFGLAVWFFRKIQM